ncbi:MAG: diguanylate cyclase [bacterium]|nr:diguanylate cyclase [bacterium]MDD5757399.1 diguanylate cyclase [bacterium]
MDKPKNDQQHHSYLSLMEKIVEFFPDPVFVIDQGKKVIAWNLAMEKLTGVTKAEMIGKGDYAYAVPFYGKGKPMLIDLIDLHDSAIEARYQDFRREGNTLYAEIFLPNMHHGEGAYLSIKASPLYDAEGVLVGAIESFRDISTQKEAEQALKESENKFRTLAEESPNIIFINKSGRIVYTNKKAEETMGYTRQELYSPAFDFMSLIAAESHWQTKSAYDKHQKGLNVPGYEYVLQTISGKKLHALITTKLIDFQGTTAILGIITDITKQKEIELILSDSDKKYRSTLDALPEAVHVVDRDLHILLINQAFIKMNKEFGISSDIVGKTVFEAFPFLPDQVLLEYEQVFKKGQVLATEESNLINKEMSYTQTTKIPIVESGKVTKILTVIRNVSAQKREEQELIRLGDKILAVNKKLKHLALKDSQTGLFNHRYFTETINLEFARAKREKNALALIMIDIDYFKSINDVYGHSFGDLVIKQLATLLKKLVRHYNPVIRFGGEEFVIIAVGLDRSAATDLGQRLLDKVNETAFGHKKQKVRLKLSIAVVSYPEQKMTKPADFLEKADHLLLKAKEFGGNRVYSSLDDSQVKKETLNKKGSSLKYLKEKMDRLNKRANQSLIEAIFAFARTIELKDHYTGEHVEETVNFATDIAKALKLPNEDILLIKQASILHDLGKIGISEKILLKPGKLNGKELEAIKKHPLIGADIIRPIQLLHGLLPYIVHHHERWDGKGYPSGLKGEEIPVGARIIALADVYQALTSNRPYRKAYKKSEAIQIIKKEAGSHFDPQIVAVFLNVLKKGKK